MGLSQIIVVVLPAKLPLSGLRLLLLLLFGLLLLRLLGLLLLLKRVANLGLHLLGLSLNHLVDFGHELLAKVDPLELIRVLPEYVEEETNVLLVREYHGLLDDG